MARSEESPFDVRLEWEPAEETVKPLQLALRAYNEGKVGNYKGRTLSAFAIDREGQRVGGIYGWIQWGWLYVDWAHVDERARRHGIGRRLLATVENAAREAGIRRARLNTGSFQGALPFYLSQGYRVFAELEITAEHAEGQKEHVDYFLRKELGPAGQPG